MNDNCLSIKTLFLFLLCVVALDVACEEQENNKIPFILDQRNFYYKQLEKQEISNAGITLNVASSDNSMKEIFKITELGFPEIQNLLIKLEDALCSNLKAQREFEITLGVDLEGHIGILDSNVNSGFSMRIKCKGLMMDENKQPN